MAMSIIKKPIWQPIGNDNDSDNLFAVSMVYKDEVYIFTVKDSHT